MRSFPIAPLCSLVQVHLPFYAEIVTSTGTVHVLSEFKFKFSPGIASWFLKGVLFFTISTGVWCCLCLFFFVRLEYESVLRAF
ncbi:hypothetical protein BDW59DRAFT_129279 [Aspergillus cavernicola]|uniref:Uncharacterized protein n=1 Tax=Aspergillus cavernicola TaxID=176166 RepID=A0ABR4HTV4_9EURO